MKKVILLLISSIILSCSNENIIDENSNQEMKTLELKIYSKKDNNITDTGLQQENFKKLWKSDEIHRELNNMEVLESNKGKLFNCLDFFESCNNNSLIVTNPFNTNLMDLYGYYYGDYDCDSSNVNDCFGIRLRMELINEFGRHTNNVNVIAQEIDNIQDYTYAGGCYNEIYVYDTFGIPNDNDGIYTPAETNYMYREIICRILEDYDTNASEYLSISLSTLDFCLCGNTNRVIRLEFAIYRDN